MRTIHSEWIRIIAEEPANIDEILALDLGTKTGFAHWKRGNFGHGTPRASCGTWLLAETREIKGMKGRRTEDPRFSALHHRVSEILAGDDKTVLVAWEDVQFVHSAYQICLWVALRSAVWAACEWATTRPEVLSRAVPVGTLKKLATGSGSADKDLMRRAAIKAKLISPVSTLDDNAIDAAHLLNVCFAQHIH
jgi:hypothetical protein